MPFVILVQMEGLRDYPAIAMSTYESFGVDPIDDYINKG